MVKVRTLFKKNTCGAKLKIGKNTQKCCEGSLKCWEYYRKKDRRKKFHQGVGGCAEKKCKTEVTLRNWVTSDEKFDR